MKMLEVKEVKDMTLAAGSTSKGFRTASETENITSKGSRTLASGAGSNSKGFRTNK